MQRVFYPSYEQNGHQEYDYANSIEPEEEKDNGVLPDASQIMNLLNSLNL